MPSSRRVIKSTYAINDLKESVINTDYKVIYKEEAETDEEVDNSSDESEQLLKKAQLKSQEIIRAAQTESEELKMAAQKEGFEQGEADGFEKGYKEGYNQATEKVEVEYQEKQAHFIERVQQANEQINEYKTAVKEELLNFSLEMAKKIIHEKIDASEEGVLAIAKPYFFQLDKDEELLIITIHPDAQDKVDENLHKVQSVAPETRIIILSNPDLEENGLIVETSKSVADFQVGQQLENMLKELIETERTIDG